MRRNAVLFVLISLLSGFGSTAMTLAAGLWVLELTGSVSLAALTAICVYLPTFAAPWLGGVVDRLPRRPLLIVVDLALGALVLTLLAVRSADAVWLIFAVLLARGVSYVLIDAGETAVLPSALAPKILADVNGWRSSAQEGAKLLAPLSGAALYAWRGPYVVVLLSAALPLLTAACYAVVRLPGSPPLHLRRGARLLGSPPLHLRRGARLLGSPPLYSRRGARLLGSPPLYPRRGARLLGSPPLPPPRGVPDEGLSRVSTGGEVNGESRRSAPREGEGRRGAPDRGFRAGLRALFGVRAVRTPVLVAAAAIGASGLKDAAVLAHLVHDLGLPATHLGYLGTAQGAGSIVGGLVVGRVLARLSPDAVAAVGAVVFAAGCLVLTLPWFPVMVAGGVLVGIGLPWALIAAVTAVQTRTPDHLLGRVAATSNTVMFGPVAAGIPLGAAGVHLGAVVPLIAAAGVGVAAAVVATRADRV